MKKRKKILLSILLIVAIILSGFYQILIKTKPVNDNSNSIKIYVMGNEKSYDGMIKRCVETFEKKYPDIKIEKVFFKNGSDDMVEEYYKKMLADTLAGEGPDVLILNQDSTIRLEKSDMLLDLKPLLENDPDFKEEDYVMQVIEAGSYKGKQAIMPLDFEVNQYVTTEELLKNNGINLDNCNSQNDFIKALNNYIDLISKDKSKFLFPAQLDIEKFIAGSGKRFIDYDKKKQYFRTEEFKEVIENYKKIYNCSKKREDMIRFGGQEGLDALKSGSALFSNDPIDMRSLFFEYESIVNQTLNEKEVVEVIPNYEGNGNITPFVMNSLAISKDTVNKEAAYNFIKIAMSEEVQGCEETWTHIPTNRKAIKKLKDNYENNKVNSSDKFFKDETIIYQPLSEEFNKYYDKITNNLDKGEIVDSKMGKMILECLKPYFDGKRSYETCINILENKVQIYLNE